MSSQYVYDKAKYHFESIEIHGLPQHHASNHTVPILRWLIENDLMSDFFLSNCAKEVAAYRRGEMTIHDLYEWWDNSLVSDMVSDSGNAFGLQYFDFQHGQYLTDYIELLQGDLPSELHVNYDETNYAILKRRIDERYKAWKKTHQPWWRIW
jgi:hypothetical protein